MQTTHERPTAFDESELEKATRIGDNLVRDFRVIIVGYAKTRANDPRKITADQAKKMVSKHITAQLKHVFRNKEPQQLEEVIVALKEAISANIDALYAEHSPK